MRDKGQWWVQVLLKDGFQSLKSKCTVYVGSQNKTGSIPIPSPIFFVCLPHYHFSPESINVGIFFPSYENI